MVSKEHRFHGLNSLRFVYGRGASVRATSLAVKYGINNRRDTYRVAVVVSKKVNKSAVVRNRIRRRLYEQIRLLEDQITQPYDIVITVFSDSLAELPAAKLTNQLQTLLKKANII